MASRFAAGGGRQKGAWPYPELVLAVLGALSVLPPYIGPPLGLDLKVAADVEVVDHVVAGTVVALGAALAALLARRAQRAGLSDPGIALAALCGLCFLGGLWQVATHVPLVLDGGSPEAPWGTVALHSTAGVPITALALWLTLRTPD